MAFGLDDILGEIPIIGDIGPRLPLVGPLLFGEPAQEQLQQQLAATAQAYDEMRLPMRTARWRGLNQALGQFNPAADMLGQMYGQQFRPPTQVANPMEGLMGDVAGLQSPFNPANAPQQQAPAAPPPPALPPAQAFGRLFG